MSLKDRLRFKGYPLPLARASALEYAIEGMDGVVEQLEVREDGSFWRDRNSGWLPQASEVPNASWERAPLTAELLVFPHSESADVPLRWSLYFADGLLREVHPVGGSRRRVALDEA